MIRKAYEIIIHTCYGIRNIPVVSGSNERIRKQNYRLPVKEQMTWGNE
jgi:hypothetical protein